MSCPLPTPPTTVTKEPNQNPCPSSSIDQNHCILLIGFCALDIIHMSDEWPAEDIKQGSYKGYWARGGNCSNSCTVLRQFNANCEYLGNLSSNPGFAVLTQDFQNRGIIIKNCPPTPMSAPLCSIVIAKNGTRTILVAVNDFPHYTYENFRNLDLRTYTWIHFEALNFEEMSKMIKEVCTFNNKGNCTSNDCERKVKLSLELERIVEEHIPMAEYVDYVFLGHEFALHLGWKTPYAAVHGFRGMLKLQEIAGFRKPNIIAPWGSQGAAFLTSDDQYELVPASSPPTIVDSVGAGDTFVAGVIYAIDVLHRSLSDAVAFGNRAAGFKIGYKGYDDLHKFFIAEMTTCNCKK